MNNKSPQQHLLASGSFCNGQPAELFRLAPIGIFKSTPLGRFLCVNPAMSSMYGFNTPEEMLSQVSDISTQIYHDPADRKIFMELLAGQGRVTDFECRHVRADGTGIWVSMSASELHTPETGTFYQGFIMDITQRKEAEAEAAREAILNKTLLGALGEGVYGIDMNGLCTFVNPAALKMLEMSEKELIGRDQHELFHCRHPDGSVYDRAACPVFNTLKDGQTRQTDDYFITGSKNLMPVKLTVSPTYMDNQQAGAVVVFRDTSRLKSYQKSLRIMAESNVQPGEDMFSFLVKNIAQSQDKCCAFIASVDENLPEKAMTLAVWERGKIRDNFCYDLAGTPCENIVRQGTCLYSEKVQEKFPDDHLLIEMGVESYWGSPLKNSSGRVTGLIALMDDQPMTQDRHTLSLLKSFAIRAAAEMETRSFRENYQFLFESMSQGVVYLDTSGNILKANPSARKILGLSRKDIQEKQKPLCRLQMVFEDGTPCPDHQRPCMRAISSGREITNEVMGIYNQETGSRAWIIITAVPLFSPLSSSPYMVYTTFQDITQLKNIQSQLVQARKEAEAASLAKSEFLANMSHEIRTPLNGVIGMTDHLLGTRLDEDQKQYAQVIKSSGDALLSLINDILDFSKIEAGKFKIQPHDFNLRNALENYARNISTRCSDNNLEFALLLDPALPSCVKGDELRLFQILENLMNNALKFTEQDKITLKADVAEEKDPEIRVRFSVTDTGTGIPKEKQGVLFHKFSQVDGTTRRKHGGTGLGLAISRQLAELMQGQIGVNSRPGQGSEFWFTVKFQKDVHQCPAPVDPLEQSQAEQPGTALEKTCILLAEDNQVNQLVVSKMLKKLGHEVVIVSGGYQAVEEYSRGLCRLILMDIQMPEMDGLEATRRIRALEQADSSQSGSRIPIIAITAHALHEERQKAFDAGMDDYLTKPLKTVHLQEILSKWLPGRPGPDQPPETVQTASESWFKSQVFMERIMEDKDLAREILEMFLKSIPEHLRTISTQLKAGNPEAVMKAAHSIKGTAANTESVGLSSKAAALEQAARENDRQTMASLAPELEKLFTRTRQEMKEFLKNL